MVVLNRIYTRTGDDGTTALGSGERLAKYDLRVAAYGTVDELNATIGMARLHTVGPAPVDAMLARRPGARPTAVFISQNFQSKRRQSISRTQSRRSRSPT